jgi:hypothetical protein
MNYKPFHKDNYYRHGDEAHDQGFCPPAARRWGDENDRRQGQQDRPGGPEQDRDEHDDVPGLVH